MPWPPRSPDLTPCNYFLWGYLKSKVYVDKPRTLQDLKDAITREIAAIPMEMLDNVMSNFAERLEQCINQQGRHLLSTIFRN
ncbi:hypothetical protein GE061_002893 [Apolygus lucorum]|uniref:Uncharacterized protein n=1 Tax=Apolygus lucorum TaxID=248454 RepID=A0A6A4JUG8_APOLU|nr:hypothetical protein GE061_002893 [Apolygus lucorum]